MPLHRHGISAYCTANTTVKALLTGSAAGALHRAGLSAARKNRAPGAAACSVYPIYDWSADDPAPGAGGVQRISDI